MAAPARYPLDKVEYKDYIEFMSETNTKLLPASQAENFDPARYELRWNADFTAFDPVKLQWHDDASYAAWQASDKGGNENG